MGSPAFPGTERLWERLDALYDENVLDRIPRYIQPELFHYTNVEGLKGIIESNTLWATSAYYLNDSSEVEYGCQLVAQTIDEWLTANPNPNPGTAPPLLALESLRDSFAEPSSRAGRHVGIYVVCFCEDGNLLSQWRAYSQAGGYSIGMLASELEMGMRAPGFFDTRLLKVNYNRQQQRANIHSILRKFVQIVEDRGLYTLPAEQDMYVKFMSQLALFLQELLMDGIVAFKNPAFQEEREWRIVVRPRLIEIQRARQQQHEAGGQRTNRGGGDYHYRHSKGVLVPYLKLAPAENERLPIHSLRFGPSLDKAKAEYGLLGFLVTHGYRNISVTGSDMPVIL